MKRISLTQGKFALVSNRDYDWLMQWKWHLARDYKTEGLFYAARFAPTEPNGHRTKVFMHREIFGGTCDHKNRNGLDNRRKNLRKATFTEQMHNKGLRRNNTSGFIGLNWREDKQRWQVKIRIEGRYKHLGYFKDKTEAALAYDKAAYNRDPEFCVLNFPNVVNESKFLCKQLEISIARAKHEQRL